MCINYIKGKFRNIYTKLVEMDRFKTHAAADVVASPIEKQEDLAQTLGEIDPGVYDFVLRCVTEPFKGKFIYINMSEEGEVIGSGDPLIDPQYVLYIGIYIYIYIGGRKPVHRG